MPKKHSIDLFDTFPVSFKANASNNGIIMKDAASGEIKTGMSLICEVDATHAGTLINNRIYPPEAMKKGIRTWTAPYKKPILTNHDDTKDPIGRVVAAKYLKTDRGITDEKDWKPILRESEGYGYQRLTVKITDAEAIKKILDGRYQTVSVRMSTDHCYCSICDTDWSAGEGPCEHTPGSKYEGKLAYMTTGDLSYREMSFVNIPADEYAGVKEAIIADQKNTTEINLYANNDSEKVLSDLETGDNLYALLDSEAEASDDVVAYLLDKSSKAMTINKEEDVKLTELTKDQLKDLDPVKELINEAMDKAKKDCEGMVKNCKDELEKIKKDNDANLALLEDAKKKKEEEEKEKKKGKEEKEEEEDKKKCNCGAKEGEKHKSSCAMAADPGGDVPAGATKPGKAGKDEEGEEEEDGETEEDKKKKKKGSPVPDELPENKGKGKSGGVKHGAGNLGPVQEEPASHGNSAELDKTKELEDANKKVLDENVKINAELHKMVAERLYDLKRTLGKPDIGPLTQAERDKKVEEFAQRSIDSLKDQINDLLIEQENARTTGLSGDAARNPGISQPDMTDEIMEGKKNVREGKKETLTRLFPKSA